MSSIPKGYKQTEAGVVPGDWDVRSIGSEIDRLEAGVSVNSVDEARQVYPHEQSILKTSAVTNGRFLAYEAKKIAPRDVSRAQLNPRADRIIVSRMNTPDLVGECGYVDKDYPDLFLPDRLWMTRVRQGSDISVKWLAYLLTSEAYKRRLKGAATGTSGSMKNLAKDAFLSLPIPFPIGGEQRAIAAALSDVDALLAKLDQLIAKKRDLKQAAMQQLLTGQTRLPGFSGAWEVKRLGEIFTFSGGLSASRDQLSDSGHCYLHYGDIHLSRKTFIDIEAEILDIPKLDVALADVSSSALLKDGDIVFVDASEDDDGTSRHLVVVNPGGRPYISGLHTIVAKSKGNNLGNLFKRYCFETRNIKEQFRFYAVGTKVSGISKTSIAKIELFYPPSLPEQTAIATILSDMDAEITALEARRDKTRALKQGMMQELLTGRIRLV